MPNTPAPRLTLSEWLSRLESQHPTEIDLGLDRVAAVAEALARGAAVARQRLGKRAAPPHDEPSTVRSVERRQHRSMGL